MSIQWSSPPSAMANRMDNYAKRLLSAVHGLGDAYAAEAESTAKSGARWTDRTANARQGLSGRSISRADGVEIVLSQGVSYGIFLELRWGGKYAIVMPTLRGLYAPVMADMQRLVR